MTPRPHGPEERELAADAAVNERGLTNFDRMARAEARVEELEAALSEANRILHCSSPSDEVWTRLVYPARDVLTRALRGSVPAGEED